VNTSQWIANRPAFGRPQQCAAVLALLLGWLPALLWSAAALADTTDPLVLNEDVPLTYTVEAGDTLWDISAIYLRDPWRWETLWAGNPQIDNPHLIYPGDVLTLVWQDGEPRLVRAGQGEVKLSPRMRPSPLDLAIPAIPREQIDPFLRQHRVVGEAVLERAPYIVAGDSGRLISGVGDRVYGSGPWPEDEPAYRVVRRGEPLVDPVSGENLGIFVSDVGTASLIKAEQSDKAAPLIITEMNEEIRIGDRLMPVVEGPVVASYQPRAPEVQVENAFMIAVAGGVTQIGALDIVVINRGARESLSSGDVLAIYRRGETVTDPVTRDPVQLPDIRAGVLMVFAVFERASFGLVLEATRPLAVGDKLLNP
jgi:hypothetical protein